MKCREPSFSIPKKGGLKDSKDFKPISLVVTRGKRFCT